MGLFRRRRRGRHALGAAVQGLPARPLVVPAAPMPPMPRVELGFRDGSTAALAPESPQAKALRAVADLLAARD